MGTQKWDLSVKAGSHLRFAFAWEACKIPVYFLQMETFGTIHTTTCCHGFLFIETENAHITCERILTLCFSMPNIQIFFIILIWLDELKKRIRLSQELNPDRLLNS